MLLESAPTKQDEGGALSLQNPARNPNTKRNQHLQSNWVPKTQGVCVVKHRALPTVNITANRQLIQLARTNCNPCGSTASTACLPPCLSLPATQARSVTKSTKRTNASAPIAKQTQTRSANKNTKHSPKHRARPKTRSATQNTGRTNTAAAIAEQPPSPIALRPRTSKSSLPSSSATAHASPGSCHRTPGKLALSCASPALENFLFMSRLS